MPGPADRPIRKFNPGTFQSDAEVTEQFVVRNHELGVLLDVLRGNVESPSCQHALIVAPRGRGKTMLLSRVAAEICTTPELARRLLPVRFMEESQEIFNLTDFWLETLFHLARECVSHDSGLAEELRDRHAALSERWREQTLEEHARAAVLHAADRLDRRLVLMVENLQALCKDVDQDFGWKLRGVLQTEPQITLIASATSRFTGLEDAEQPFFEMFRIINLRPLTIEECRSLWTIVSGDRVSGREMRPLEILTGGNPRLLVIVAGFAQHKSLRRLMEELVMLIDEHTEYFRGHLEVLGKTERRVYIAVLDLWQLSTPGEIAARARMDVRVVSTMLGRLVGRGALVVEGSGRKRKYAAAEPLYCIYYKLRRGRGEAAIVESLIRFMAVFYNEAEQTEWFPVLMREAAESPTIQDGLERAAAGVPELHKLLALEDMVASERESVQRLYREISAAFRDQRYNNVISKVDIALVSPKSGSSPVSRAFTAWVLSMKGEAHELLDDPASAVSAYQKVVERFGASEDPELRRFVLRAQIHRAGALQQLSGPESAVPVYEDVVERVGDSEDPELLFWLATALSDKGDALCRVGDLDAAATAYDEVIGCFGDSERPEWLSCVARALYCKGRARTDVGDLSSALSAYGEIVERFGGSESPTLLWWVAESLILRGRVFHMSGELEAAISAYEEVVERYGTGVNLWLLQRQVAAALIHKMELQTDAGNAVAALRTYDELEPRLNLLDPIMGNELTWQAMRARMQALFVERDSPLLIDTFRSLYDVLVPGDETMIREMLDLVSESIVAGLAARELVEILSSDGAKAAALTPLLVALNQYAGETVRAPDEVLEVASDIRERIKERKSVRN